MPVFIFTLVILQITDMSVYFYYRVSNINVKYVIQIHEVLKMPDKPINDVSRKTYVIEILV